MEAKFVNLTPHDINIVLDGRTITIPPSGTEARVEQLVKHDRMLDYDGAEIPLTHNDYGDVYGLPAPRYGTWLIVSSMVAGACLDRLDLVIPNETVRDERGRIIGCRSLARR